MYIVVYTKASYTIILYIMPPPPARQGEAAQRLQGSLLQGGPVGNLGAMCIYTYVYIYIHIYIYRERDIDK